MLHQVEEVLRVFRLAEWVAVIPGLLVGWEALSHPAKAIQRYQILMRRLNWQVCPVEMQLELRSTRRLGLLLVLLSTTLALLLLRT